MELLEKSQQLSQLTKDFEEFQETSRAVEAELEYDIENQAATIQALQSENDILKEQIKTLKEDFRKKLFEVEKHNDKLMKELKITTEKLKTMQRHNKELEIDYDILTGKIREKEYENDQLTQYYHRALEDLAITCSELDDLKDHNAETTQRLKDQLRELNNELEIIQQSKFKRMRKSYSIVDTVLPECKLKSTMVGKNSLDMVDSLLGSLSSRLKSYQV
ncbi:hypothetical protein SteCoe_21023 [Stentor coeruleus]|uniref:Cilia- and flagella-associated protein 157 n=1 Tax=Stentor coeruleus TaxID=5963 RepID=A0A1R2BQQ4_9CILI|nr:hypothetical protein SteCoe_21023 [Stentor coeruleus]